MIIYKDEYFRLNYNKIEGIKNLFKLKKKIKNQRQNNQRYYNIFELENGELLQTSNSR